MLLFVRQKVSIETKANKLAIKIKGKIYRRIQKKIEDYLPSIPIIILKMQRRKIALHLKCKD